MYQPLGFIGSSQPMGFFALIIIGGLAGWIAGMIMGSRHWIFTNILIGIAGSYVGSELAQIANFGLRNSLDHFLAALVGSIIVLWIWRALHPPVGNPPTHI
ncbi:MAG: GlsB/YeaQ/YmgE family stress response membrane protein [Hyphomicrobiales bacterium]